MSVSLTSTLNSRLQKITILLYIVHLKFDAFIQSDFGLKYICPKKEKQYISDGTVWMFIERAEH